MDKRLTDSEIVKALNQCTCSETNCHGCPYWDASNCSDRLCMDALDLINRLQTDVDNYKQIAENQQKIILDKAFENKRLRTSNDALRMANELCKGWEERAKAEAYKVFLPLLENFRNEVVYQFIDMCDGNDYNKLNLMSMVDTIDCIYKKHINNILKELAGEDNG